MRIVIATLSILFAGSVVTIAFFNTELVTVVLWPGMAEYTFPLTPVSWVIFFSAFAGFLFTGIIAVLEGSKTRLANSRLRAQVKRLQQEVELLHRPSLDFSRIVVPSGAPAAAPDGDETAESPEGA